VFDGRRREAIIVAEKIVSILNNKDDHIWSVGPDETVYDAIALMADKRIGALLVVSERKLIGIISERDYARKIILRGRSSRDTPVREIMTSSLITVTPDHTVDECMRLVTEHRIRHLPVLDNDRLVGLISIGDLVNSIIEAQAQTINHLHSYITGGYPS
jgi:predicted transcriptional regulator